MPRKRKTKPLETVIVENNESEDNDDVKADTYDEVVNLIQGSDNDEVCDIEDVPPPVVEKVKKIRAPRKNKEAEPPIEVSEDEDPEKIIVIDEPICVEEPKIEEDKKKDENIKVVELLQCEKCGRQLTARTLKYSHNAVCPANGNKTPPKSKRVKPDDDVSEDVKTPNKVERIRKRQEKFNNLFTNAV
jgi:hypothetical protein